MDAAVRATPLRETASLFVADFRVPIRSSPYRRFWPLRPRTSACSRPLCRGFPASPLLGVVLVLCGVIWRSWAAGTLRKGLGLATLGPYSLVRHPLYFGSGLMLLGFCQLTCSPLHYLPLVAVMAAVYTNTMLREERFLGEKYAADWPAYRNRTRREFFRGRRCSSLTAHGRSLNGGRTTSIAPARRRWPLWAASVCCDGWKRPAFFRRSLSRSRLEICLGPLRDQNLTTMARLVIGQARSRTRSKRRSCGRSPLAATPQHFALCCFQRGTASERRIACVK